MDNPHKVVGFNPNKSVFINPRLNAGMVGPKTGLVTLHRATLNRATVNRRQFTGRHLTGATVNRSDR